MAQMEDKDIKSYFQKITTSFYQKRGKDPDATQ